MLTPGVVKDYNSEFNGISKDLVSYVQRQGNGPEGVSVLQDSATSFFKLTHECKHCKLSEFAIQYTYVYRCNIRYIWLDIQKLYSCIYCFVYRYI